MGKSAEIIALVLPRATASVARTISAIVTPVVSAIPSTTMPKLSPT